MHPLVWVQGLPYDVFGDGGAVIEHDRTLSSTPLSIVEQRMETCTTETAFSLLPLWPGEEQTKPVSVRARHTV